MIKDLLKEGFALKQKGHYKHAIAVFYKALEEDNTSTELLLEIADLYYKLEEEQKALSYIEQVLEQQPTNINALKQLKNIFKEKNALEEAEQAAKNIYCVSHNTGDLAEILYLLNLQGKYSEVFEYKNDNPDYRIFLEQSKALYYQKDYKKAEEILRQALQTAPENQDILLMLGKTLYAQKQYDECNRIKDCLQDKDDAELLNFKGLINTYLGNYKSAASEFLNAIRISNKTSEYYYNLANLYLKQGDNLQAKKYYNYAISLEPDNSNYHFALANIYYLEKHYKRALEELQEDFFEAKLLKAIILYDTGYLAIAKREFEKLAQENSDSNILMDYMSKIERELSFN